MVWWADSDRQLDTQERMTQTQLSYDAGLFDGEGSVVISPAARQIWTLRAIVSNTHKPTLDRMKLAYGGSVNRNQVNVPLHYKNAWYWSVSGSRAGAFLAAIRPYSIIKAGEIDLALGYLEQRPGQGFHNEAQAVIASGYRDKIRELRKVDWNV